MDKRVGRCKECLIKPSNVKWEFTMYLHTCNETYPTPKIT